MKLTSETSTKIRGLDLTRIQMCLQFDAMRLYASQKNRGTYGRTRTHNHEDRFQVLPNTGVNLIICELLQVSITNQHYSRSLRLVLWFFLFFATALTSTGECQSPCTDPSAEAAERCRNSCQDGDFGCKLQCSKHNLQLSCFGHCGSCCPDCNKKLDSCLSRCRDEFFGSLSIYKCEQRDRDCSDTCAANIPEPPIDTDSLS